MHMALWVLPCSAGSDLGLERHQGCLCSGLLSFTRHALRLHTGAMPDPRGRHRLKRASSFFAPAPHSALRTQLCALHGELHQGCSLSLSRALALSQPPEELGHLPPSSLVRGVGRHGLEMKNIIRQAFQSSFCNRHRVSCPMAPMGFSFTELVFTES